MTFHAPCRQAASTRCIANAIFSALFAAVAGCASAPEPAVPGGPQTGATDTGAYPNLNVPPQAAAAAITDDDKASLADRLAGAKARQVSAGRGVGARSDPAYLEKLAKDHGDETLKAIEAQ